MYRHLQSDWNSRGALAGRSGAEIDRAIEREKELRRAIALKCASGVIPDDLAREQLKEMEQKIAQLNVERSACHDRSGDLEELLRFAVAFLHALGDK